MTQEHDLRHSAPCRPWGKQSEEVIAKDHLHRLIQCNALVGNADKMHQAAAVKKHAKCYSTEGKHERPWLKTRQIVQSIDIDGGVNDGSRDTDNKNKKE